MQRSEFNAIFVAHVLVVALSIPPLTPPLAAQSPPQPPSASPQPTPAPIPKPAPIAKPEQVTVTAYRAPLGVLESPTTTRLLSGESMRSTAAITFDDQLRTLPGVELFRRSSSLERHWRRGQHHPRPPFVESRRPQLQFWRRRHIRPEPPRRGSSRPVESSRRRRPHRRRRLHSGSSNATWPGRCPQ